MTARDEDRTGSLDTTRSLGTVRLPLTIQPDMARFERALRAVNVLARAMQAEMEKIRAALETSTPALQRLAVQLRYGRWSETRLESARRRKVETAMRRVERRAARSGRGSR